MLRAGSLLGPFADESVGTLLRESADAVCQIPNCELRMSIDHDYVVSRDSWYQASSCELHEARRQLTYLENRS